LTGVLATGLVVGLLLLTGVFHVGLSSPSLPVAVPASSGEQANPAARIEGPGFETAEEAAQAYLEGLRTGDLVQMLGVFAVESYVEHCDHEAYLRRMEGSRREDFERGCAFPNAFQLGLVANTYARQGDITRQVNFTFAYWVSPHLWNDSEPVFFDKDKIESEVRDFVGQTLADFSDYQFTDLTDIQVVASSSLVPAELDPKNLQSVSEKLRRVYGLSAEEYRDDIALTFSLDGKTWVFAPTVGQYNGRWYLVNTWSILSINLEGHSFTGGLAILE